LEILDKGEDTINKEIVSNLIKKELHSLPELTISEDVVIKKLEDIIQTQLIQKYKHNFTTALFEYNLSIPFKDNYLNGIIDLMIQTDDDK